MEKIAKEAMPALLPVSKGRNTLLRAQLLQLQIGEGLFLPKAEWRAKSKPSYIINKIKKTHGFIYEYGFKIDGTGWLFRRVG